MVQVTLTRSEANAVLRDARDFFSSFGNFLPPQALWSVEEWLEHKNAMEPAIRGGCGWDIFKPAPDYAKEGLTLYTLTNGYPGSYQVYAEKLLMSIPGQVCPMHYHAIKQEDIICAGGSNMHIELYRAENEKQLSDKPVEVVINGGLRTVKAGEELALKPGERITLAKRMFHRFWADPNGAGPSFIREVSMVNDDATDNYFLGEIGRFADVIEDEPILWPLCTDYKKLGIAF
ncbi:MAG: D-lyxose/D-mannose family sugar isomerase [Armatimonadota bacterium]|nr:D-lyxose/D-mannose family sugar isomerase [Armatimonadota bacterium]